MDSLKAMAAPMSKVKRDGAVKTIEAKILVPGTFWWLKAAIGSVPTVSWSNVRILRWTNPIDGESVPVFKTADSKR